MELASHVGQFLKEQELIFEEQRKKSKSKNENNELKNSNTSENQNSDISIYTGKSALLLRGKDFLNLVEDQKKKLNNSKFFDSEMSSWQFQIQQEENEKEQEKEKNFNEIQKRFENWRGDISVDISEASKLFNFQFEQFDTQIKDINFQVNNSIFDTNSKNQFKKIRNDFSETMKHRKQEFSKKISDHFRQTSSLVDVVPLQENKTEFPQKNSRLLGSILRQNSINLEHRMKLKGYSTSTLNPPSFSSDLSFDSIDPKAESSNDLFSPKRGSLPVDISSPKRGSVPVGFISPSKKSTFPEIDSLSKRGALPPEIDSLPKRGALPPEIDSLSKRGGLPPELISPIKTASPKRTSPKPPTLQADPPSKVPSKTKSQKKNKPSKPVAVEIRSPSKRGSVPVDFGSSPKALPLLESSPMRGAHRQMADSTKRGSLDTEYSFETASNIDPLDPDSSLQTPYQPDLSDLKRGSFDLSSQKRASLDTSLYKSGQKNPQENLKLNSNSLEDDTSSQTYYSFEDQQ